MGGREPGLKHARPALVTAGFLDVICLLDSPPVARPSRRPEWARPLGEPRPWPRQ